MCLLYCIYVIGHTCLTKKKKYQNEVGSLFLNIFLYNYYCDLQVVEMRDRVTSS